MRQTIAFLKQEEVPNQRYNIQGDLPNPVQPYLHPGTGKPTVPEDWTPLFPMDLIEREFSTER